MFVKNSIIQNSFEIINRFEKMLGGGEYSLKKAEQDWDNGPLVKLIENGIDSDEKVELFKNLVEREASLNVKSNPLSWNILHYLTMASQMNIELRQVNGFEKEVIKTIIEKQPSLINEKDATGYTPLAYAVENEEADVVRLFASKGADLNASMHSVTNQVETLVDIALKNFDKDVLLVLSNQEKEKVYKITDAVFKRIISGEDSKNYKKVLEALHANNKLGFFGALHQNKMAIMNIAIEKNDFAILDNTLVGSDIGPLNYFTKEQFDEAKESKDPTNTIVRKINEFYRKYQYDYNWVNHERAFFKNIEENKIDELKLLIEKGADIYSIKDQYGDTPLHDAARGGKSEAIKALLEAAGERKFELLSLKDKYGNTPLHRAARGGKSEAIKALSEAAGERKFELLSLKDKDGNTPLRDAARRGKSEAIKAILEAAGERKFELLSMQDKDGNTPLHAAARWGNTEAIKALLEAAGDRKFELLFMQNKYGNTILHEAAISEKPEAIKALLEAAGERKIELLSLKDKYGNTPLHKAASEKEPEAIKALLEAAGERKFELLSMKNENGDTPLHDAARRGNTEAVKALLEAVGERKFELLSMKNIDGNTPLSEAASRGRLGAVKALLEAAGERKIELLSQYNYHKFYDYEKFDSSFYNFLYNYTVPLVNCISIPIENCINSKTPAHFFSKYLIKEVFSLQGESQEVLSAVESHMSYCGIKESFFGSLFRTFERTCAIMPAIYGEDISANVTFQNEVDSVLDKIRHDLRANPSVNEGIAR